MSPIQWGPFAIDAFIAEGGGGAVWRAHHARSGRPVAVKVIPAPNTRLPDDVRIELEALSSMVHPNVVWVYDYGRVPADVVAPGDIPVSEGWIWVAMELAGGTLADLPLRTWGDARDAIVQMLDALSYAHSRGVLHRDVKPGNVLLGTDGRLKLSDFGIAIVHGETQHQAAGTLAYMAPEQQLGDLANTGPHSDLFAAAVTIWRVLCGTRPFDGAGRKLVMQKMREERTPFAPRVATPDGLEGWLRTCMRPSPLDRFALAADAKHALLALSTVRRRAAPQRGPIDDAPTEVSAAPVELETPIDPVRHDRPRPTPMDTNWREPEVEVARLLNVGLELFGMRARRTVARELEREQLWTTLQRVRQTGDRAVTLIEGASGMGRKHIALWLAERALETGAARRAVLSFETPAGVRDALRSLFTHDSDPDAIEAAMDAFEERWGSIPLEHKVTLLQVLETGAVSAGAPDAFATVIRKLATNRPVVWVIQDVHHGGEPYVRALLAGPPVPVHVVVTAPDTAEVPDLGQQHIELEALDEDQGIAFCRGLLALEPKLSLQLSKLTEGNPGFALEVCHHWARAGALVPGTQGYRLAPGHSASLPDLRSWSTRLETFLAAHTGLGDLLLGAALLGRDVSIEHLRALGRDAAESCVDALLSEGLIRLDGRGFKWQHSAFRESVLVNLENPQVAARVAELLRDVPHLAAQRAVCLQRSGQHDLAFDALHSAISDALDATQDHEILQLFPRAIEAAERAQIPAGDRRIEVIWIARVRAVQAIVDKSDLIGIIAEAREMAKQRGFAELEAWCLYLEIRWVLEPREKEGPLKELVGRLANHTPGVLHADSLDEAALWALGFGKIDQAVRYYERAVKFAEQAGLRTVSEYENGLAQALTTRGDYDAAMALAQKSEADSSGGRAPVAEMLSVMVQWEILFEQDRHQAGIERLEDAKRLARRMGDAHEWFFHACAGFSLRVLGRPEAERVFRQCLDAPSNFGDFYAHVGLLSLADDRSTFETHWAELDRRWLKRNLANFHIARMLAETGDHLLHRGLTAEAVRAYRTSARQFRKIGRDASELETLIERLDSGVC